MTIEEAYALKPGTLVVLVADAENDVDRHFEELGDFWYVNHVATEKGRVACYKQKNCTTLRAFLPEHIQVAAEEDLSELLTEVSEKAQEIDSMLLCSDAFQDLNEFVEMGNTDQFAELRRLVSLLPQ
jgi:hypothetical protein